MAHTSGHGRGHPLPHAMYCGMAAVQRTVQSDARARHGDFPWRVLLGDQRRGAATDALDDGGCCCPQEPLQQHHDMALIVRNHLLTARGVAH